MSNDDCHEVLKKAEKPQSAEGKKKTKKGHRHEKREEDISHLSFAPKHILMFTHTTKVFVHTGSRCILFYKISRHSGTYRRQLTADKPNVNEYVSESERRSRYNQA